MENGCASGFTLRMDLEASQLALAQDYRLHSRRRRSSELPLWLAFESPRGPSAFDGPCVFSRSPSGLRIGRRCCFLYIIYVMLQRASDPLSPSSCSEVAGIGSGRPQPQRKHKDTETLSRLQSPMPHRSSPNPRLANALHLSRSNNLVSLPPVLYLSSSLPGDVETACQKKNEPRAH